MIILGIDPGKDGFLCSIDSKGFLEAWPTPTIKLSTKSDKRSYDIPSMRRIIIEALPDLVVIEKQQAMSGVPNICPVCKRNKNSQGVTSTFSTGQGFGLWEGLIAGIGIKYIIVPARTWQSVCTKNMPGETAKIRSIYAASHYFPDVDLRKNDRCRTYHDGKADALNLAWYGRWISWGSEDDAK